MDKIEDYDFNKNDWGHFHDVIFDVTYGGDKIDLNQEEMEKLFWELPKHMRIDAHKYGMSDTPWRDNLWEWYEHNKMGNVV